MVDFDLKHSTSIHNLPLSGTTVEPRLLKLEELIEFSAQLLPACGPIGAFVFQNPLHALEYLPFEEALRRSQQLFGCQTYLSEARYRQELERNRIQALDLRAVLEEESKTSPWELINGLVSRLDLRLAMLRGPFLVIPNAELHWHCEETQARSRFGSGTSQSARQQLLGDAKRWVVRDIINKNSPDGGYHVPGVDDPRRRHILFPLMGILEPLLSGVDRAPPDEWADVYWEEFAVRSLWQVCQHGVRKVPARPEHHSARNVRPRDALLAATGVDTDNLVHEVLVRFCAAFSDQGLAAWPLPGRKGGFRKAFAELYGAPGAVPGRWCRDLPHLLRGQEHMDSLTSIRDSLEALGIGEEEWQEFLPATLLTLRGWVSMLRQMEVQADRVPHPVPRGTLLEYLAVRLLLERAALSHVSRQELGYEGRLQDLRETLTRQSQEAPAKDSLDQRTFLVFQVAQTFGWEPSRLHGQSDEEWAKLVSELEAFGEDERRRVFHLAFERRFRAHALAAVAAHGGSRRPRPTLPRWQAMFCLDAREESFRRHLEETDSGIETFGTAGFFSVAMYYRGAADAHFSALCPVVVRPQHWVVEEVPDDLADHHLRRARLRRFLGTLAHRFHLGSCTFSWGALLTSGLGFFATLPLVLRVVFPSLMFRLMGMAGRLVAPPERTVLTLERTEPLSGPNPGQRGFLVEEMASIGERMLRDIGLTSAFARLVVIFGHGSSSLNNPHRAAYNCGACSGSNGGPNARAIATMLNDRRVREILAGRGLAIPETTVFLGGLHNTSTDEVSFYDLDRLPATHEGDLAQAKETLEKALSRNAHERCRRFYSAPVTLTPAQARAHVLARSEDLAQTRPEFGNASNALCIVGRRERTLGLFLDRRCFLQSYDPEQDDPQGSILARILGAVVPVCQGINLEYYFSSVDPHGWGAGSKLPHNLSALLGVMDGAASDLRQGLPWQGVEIHEPVRLLFVIETTREVLLAIMDRCPVVGRVLRNEWVHVAVMEPDSGELWEFRKGSFHRYHMERDAGEMPRARSSMDWYFGRRQHLDFAALDMAAVPAD